MLMTGAVGTGVTGVGTLSSLGEGGCGTLMVVPEGVMMSPGAVELLPSEGPSVGGSGIPEVVLVDGATVVVVVELESGAAVVVVVVVVVVVEVEVASAVMFTHVGLNFRLWHSVVGR